MMTENQLSIRPFEEMDQQAARQLILNSFGNRFGYIDETLNPDLDSIMESYIAAGDIFVVAFLDQILVGTGALVTIEKGVSEMVRISTRIEYRRRGIASAIITHLIDLARQRGDRRIFMKTNIEWDDAIRLYRHHGFVEFRRIERGIGLEMWL